jgi:hypothetical protein
VAESFIRLQQHRHTADYDNATVWSRTDADKVLTVADNAFRALEAVRVQDAAQDYLLNLFLPRLPRG